MKQGKKLFVLAALCFALGLRAEPLWAAEARSCFATANDCTAQRVQVASADSPADDQGTAAKVLGANGSTLPLPQGREAWIGTAPFCAAQPAACERKGMRYLLSDRAGDGLPCLVGEKVLCACDVHADARPFYVIAHHRNAVEEADEAFAQGANAIEFDVRYSRRFGKFCVNHNSDRNCERDNLVGYLRGLKSLASKYGNRFALMVMDFKEADGNKNAGAELFEIVRNELTTATGVKVILSVPFMESSRLETLNSAVPLAGEALSVDEENNPEAVANYFRTRSIQRAAFANGTFVLGYGPNIKPSVDRAISMRGNGGFKFVYVWTLMNKSSMADYAAMGVNGIMVNDPIKLRQVIDDACFPLRLATRADNPFP